jgi:hypothetical protein
VTRTLRAAVKIGDDDYTVEETMSLSPDVRDDEIEQAVDAGRRNGFGIGARHKS